MFSCNLPMLDCARRQPSLLTPTAQSEYFDGDYALGDCRSREIHARNDLSQRRSIGL
jgi:hypothetical protein